MDEDKIPTGTKPRDSEVAPRSDLANQTGFGRPNEPGKRDEPRPGERTEPAPRANTGTGLKMALAGLAVIIAIYLIYQLAISSPA